MTRLSIDPIAPDAGVIKAAVRAIGPAGSSSCRPTRCTAWPSTRSTRPRSRVIRGEGSSLGARDPPGRGGCRPGRRVLGVLPMAGACLRYASGRDRSRCLCRRRRAAGRGDRRDRPRRRPRPGASGRACAVRGVGSPLTATSANRSGQPATADPDEVAESLGAGLDVLLDAGDPGGAPSTIVDVTDAPPRSCGGRRFLGEDPDMPRRSTAAASAPRSSVSLRAARAGSMPSDRSTSWPAWPRPRAPRSCCACCRSARSRIPRRFSAPARSPRWPRPPPRPTWTSSSSTTSSRRRSCGRSRSRSAARSSIARSSSSTSSPGGRGRAKASCRSSSRS